VSKKKQRNPRNAGGFPSTRGKSGLNNRLVGRPKVAGNRKLPTSVKRLLWGLVTAALVAPAFIFGKSWRGELWTWEEAAGASAVMFVVFIILATIRDYQK
jgi:hypothetical protein